MSEFENTPLSQPLPDDPAERIVRFARDLAWGALQKRWSPAPAVAPMGADGFQWLDFGRMDAYLAEVWDDDPPWPELLVSLGYLEITNQRESGTVDYILTPRAFDLLREPATPPNVFISYRRAESSAFGLLVVARLKAVGVQNPFIDLQIDPGAEWRAYLEKMVRECRYFILLIGPTTLESEYVREEIEWALNTPGCVIVPVTHNGFQRDHSFSEALAARQVIEVRRESAEDYELAVIKLLNLLGYTP